MSSALANGVRAAVATLVPFFLAAALGHAELAWMALGGWLGTLADPGGLRSTRAKALASFAIAGAVVVPVAERSAQSAVLATLVLALVAFAGTLARALGPAAATVGTMTAVLAAVGTAKTGDSTYFADALAFAAGAAWATLLSSVVWPVGTHRPVRRAIAAVFAEMSAYATALADTSETADAGAGWSALALLHQRRIRAAIESALTVALGVRADRPGESALGADLRVLLGAAEAQFPRLVALGVELEAIPKGERPASVRAQLRTVAATYDEIRRSVISTQTPAQPAAAHVSIAERGASPAAVHAAHLAEASDRARMLAGALGTGEPVPSDAASRAGSPAHGAMVALRNDLRELRDALSFDSVFFRHALRVTAAVIVASLVGHHIATRPHWVTVTTIAVLQPYPGPTSTRAAERVFGTVMGCVVAAMITMTIHSPLALAVVMFPLSVAAVATRPRSYRLFTFFLTPVFVLIAERHPGDWWTAAARAGDSVVGGVIALVAALVVMPSWERTRLPEALEKMIAAATSYRDAVLAGLDRRRRGDDTGQIELSIAEARRAAGIAIGEAETSLERWLAEPMRRIEQGERAMQLVTYARRLTNTCTALDSRVASGLGDEETDRAGYLEAIASYGDSLVRERSLTAGTSRLR